MTEKSEAEASDPDFPGIDELIYIDSSALAKLYVPEAESDRVDAFLSGRRGLVISQLAITEVLSAVARRKRDGELSANHANLVRDAVIADADSGSFTLLDLNPIIHREAERLLLTTNSVPLRTLDALHITLAFSGESRNILTFDRRMSEAAAEAGLTVIEV